MTILSTTVTPTTAYLGETVTLTSEVSETISSSHIAMWIIDFDETTDSSTTLWELMNQDRVINYKWSPFASEMNMSSEVQIDESMLNTHTLTFILAQGGSTGISIADNPELFTIGDPISVSFKMHLYDKVKKLGNQWFYLKDEINTLLGGKENNANKVTSLSSSSTDTQYPSAKAVFNLKEELDGKFENCMKNTDFFDMLDCVNNNFDNFPLWDIVFNIDNYNGLPSKNCSVTSNELRNIAVSQISLNTEFTSSTNYTLEFDYYTSFGSRNGFYFGTDPSLQDGTHTYTGNDGLQVLVDISNTFVETFNGTSSPTNVYTHTSNLFTSGTHHIRIVRNGANATFYIDDVELYTYTNTQYNTIGLNKWGGGSNSLSNIEITMDD